jgi:23S rRNA (adenine2503-C2)-methyltransferase
MIKIIKNLQVPTGNICIMEGDRGKLEFLSIGDYGKNSNIKADFLGITKELNGVPNGNIMPLSEKWVITISTQYGCSMDCKFCDVPLVGVGLNATSDDLRNQITEAINLHPEIKYTKRLNIHYARMGEPTFNHNVLTSAKELKYLIYGLLGDSLVHPVVSTMLPKNNRNLDDFIHQWCDIKNTWFDGNAGLQFSINSTDDEQREYMFSGNSLSLDDISYLGMRMSVPYGRKYTLNFALGDTSIIDTKKIKMLFDPDKFMIKITPLHKTKSCEDNQLIITGGYDIFTPYQEIEKMFKNEGFDVIVFIPSYDEDLGMITCGNAILSGNMPKIQYSEI